MWDSELWTRDWFGSFGSLGVLPRARERIAQCQSPLAYTSIHHACRAMGCWQHDADEQRRQRREIQCCRRQRTVFTRASPGGVR